MLQLGIELEHASQVEVIVFMYWPTGQLHAVPDRMRPLAQVEHKDAVVQVAQGHTQELHEVPDRYFPDVQAVHWVVELVH